MLVTQKRLFHNARFVCMDGKDTHAEAILTEGDRISAIGSKNDLLSLCGSTPEMIDLENTIVYPGFIDTHSHLDLLAAWSEYPYCGCPTLEKALEAMASGAAGGTGVAFGYGYDDTATKDKRGPTATELDRIFGARPALLAHISIHAAYANTAMLRMMGIDPESENDNIDIVCENGRPTGTLTEVKAVEALSHLPAQTSEKFRAGLRKAMYLYNQQGFTSCIGGGLGLNGVDYGATLRILGDLELNGEMTLRCNLPIINDKFEEALESGLLAGPGSPFVRPQGIKIITDGSIQAFTAAVPEGYYTKPDVKTDTILSQDELDMWVYKAHAAGQQVIIHGNGNGAIEKAILALEAAQKRCPRKDPHHILVHCQMVSDSQLQRMKTAGYEPTFFVLHVWNWGERHKNIFIGPERAARIDPCGSAERLGLPFSLHADTPVLPQMTMRSIHTAVNRETAQGEILGPEQRISPLEAMKAYTVYAAGMSLDQKNRGTLEPGKLADFTILDRDPRTVPKETIKDIAILGAISGGNTVFGPFAGKK